MLVRRIREMVLHARVQGGRFVIDEPADLPEGSVVELVPVEEIEPEDRAALIASIERGLAQADRGEGVAAEEALRRLRAST